MGRFISPDTFVQSPYNPQSLNRYSYCLNNPLIYTDPSGYWWGSDLWNSFTNWFQDTTVTVDPTVIQNSDGSFTLGEITVTAKKSYSLIGNDPGDISTIGFAIGNPYRYIPVGAAFSFDRVVLSDGRPDWFFTFGFGLSTPGVSISTDRGWIRKMEIDKDELSSDNPMDWFNLTTNIDKDDVIGASLSLNVDIAKRFGAGGEFVITPFVQNKTPGLEQTPSPLFTIKGGMRRAISPGINLLGNYTWDFPSWE